MPKKVRHASVAFSSAVSNTLGAELAALTSGTGSGSSTSLPGVRPSDHGNSIGQEKKISFETDAYFKHLGSISENDEQESDFEESSSSDSYESSEEQEIGAKGLAKAVKAGKHRRIDSADKTMGIDIIEKQQEEKLRDEKFKQMMKLDSHNEVRRRQSFRINKDGEMVFPGLHMTYSSYAPSKRSSNVDQISLNDKAALSVPPNMRKTKTD